jgi:catechol 2,3-dioxygenase
MATSDSTGRPADGQLAPSTAMAAVTLHVRDLAGMTAYYRDALALEVLTDAGGTGASGTTVVLGRGAVPLVVLRHTPDLPVARPGQAGLFHTALLLPDQAALAATVATAARHPRSRYVGSADHLVSEAFYFTDPEGNGIELYRDRPREAWPWADGRIQMATLALDPGAYLGEHLTESGLAAPQAAGAGVGHVHLKVGDVAAARGFYVDALGFAVMADWHGALFVSAGGYHHHLGLNTWDSAGAGPRAATLGLGQVAVTVPGRADLDALAARLRRHGVAAADDGASLRFEDPWRSRIEVSTAA